MNPISASVLNTGAHRLSDQSTTETPAQDLANISTNRKDALAEVWRKQSVGLRRSLVSGVVKKPVNLPQTLRGKVDKITGAAKSLRDPVGACADVVFD
jgi:hypothetical protein